MKHLRQLCAALVLAMVLALPVLADDGHIPCGVTSATPDASETLDGHIPCGLAESMLASVLWLV